MSLCIRQSAHGTWYSPLFNQYLRWRHSKGYGVHSPYAYRFITDVLRPGVYGYYSYLEIEKLCKYNELDDFRFQRLVKFTIRFSIFLQCKRILGTSTSRRLIEITAGALKLPFIILDHKKPFSWQKGDLLIIEGTKIDITDVEAAIKNGVTVFAINPPEKVKDLMEIPQKNGLLLKDKKKIILIQRPAMSYVSYIINLV